MPANHNPLSLLIRYELCRHDWLRNFKCQSYRSCRISEASPPEALYPTGRMAAITHLSLVLASLLSPPNAYADTCQGIHITGDIGGNSAKVIVLDNSLIGDDYRGKMQNGSTVGIQKGSIRKATVDTATTCSVAANNDGEITALKLTGATLKDVLIEGATVVISDKSMLTQVDNIRGLVTGADIDYAPVAKIPAPEQPKDPLGLEKSTEIVTLTKVTTLDKEVIPAQISLHYSASEAGTYTLFTSSHPSECWLFCSRRAKPTEDDKNFGDKTFVIPAEQLKNKVLVRSWTTGVLIVPYKYSLASHNLAQGSLTVGPYAGYTTDLWGMQLTFPLAAGITKVTVPTIQDGVVGTSERFGLSVATGLLFSPGGDASTIKTGILLGVDQIGANSGYPDNGKLWLGIYVGAGFGY